MRLKHCICGMLLFITTFAIGQTNTNGPVPAFKKGALWEDTTVRLIVADAPKEDGKAFQEIKAKLATYELNPAFTAKLNLSGPYNHVHDKLHVVMFQNPHSKKIIFITSGFYVSSPEGVKAYLQTFHSLWYSESLLELAESKGEAADIEYFESVFDVKKAVLEKIGPYQGRVIFFRHALPFNYFSDSPHPGGLTVGGELTNAEMTKGILRIDLWNPVRKMPASVWFDLKGRKVIKAKADSVEMEVADENAYWAAPKERDPKQHPWSGVYYRNDSGGVNPEAVVEVPVTVTLLPNDGLSSQGNGEAKQHAQVEIQSTRLLMALWLSRKNQGMEVAYVPVAWGERKYLVATNEMIEFCVAVNAGGEPRKTRFGKFLLHWGGERMKVTGWPEIPLKYRPYLLKEPIVATITKVGNISGGLPIAQFNSVQVVLDKGRLAGVLEGMEFYYLTQNGYGKFKVKAVSDDSAEAVVNFYGENGMRPESGWKVSTRLTTRPVPFSGESEAQWELLDESEAQFQSPFFPVPRIKSR